LENEERENKKLAGQLVSPPSGRMSYYFQPDLCSQVDLSELDFGGSITGRAKISRANPFQHPAVCYSLLKFTEDVKVFNPLINFGIFLLTYQMVC